jgi:hypothetical protein
MNMAVIWDPAACNLVDTGRRFRGVGCRQQQGDAEASVSLVFLMFPFFDPSMTSTWAITLMVEAGRTSEASVNICQNTQRNILTNVVVRT